MTNFCMVRLSGNENCCGEERFNPPEMKDDSRLSGKVNLLQSNRAPFDWELLTKPKSTTTAIHKLYHIYHITSKQCERKPDISAGKRGWMSRNWFQFWVNGWEDRTSSMDQSKRKIKKNPVESLPTYGNFRNSVKDC